jgi:glyoxylase-like metal-dependent hydrolase (beta-lactamase superfamily II)
MNKKFAFTIVSAALAGNLAHAFEVQTHTAGDAGFAVNSHLILGKREAILVDAQFTRSESKKVVELVKQSGRKLTTIFITHGHPDHYFGLETLLKEFPDAKAVATPEVMKDIQATAQGKLDYWKGIYKAELPDALTLPQTLNTNSLVLEGTKLDIVQTEPGESEHLTMLYVPTTGQLFTGDLAYHEVHLWLAEDRPEGWVKNLAAAKALPGLSKVYPGHGTGHEVAVLDEDRAYIENFLQVTAVAKDKASALKELVRRYPSYRLPIIAELSVAARVK